MGKPKSSPRLPATAHAVADTYPYHEQDQVYMQRKFLLGIWVLAERWLFMVKLEDEELKTDARHRG